MNNGSSDSSHTGSHSEDRVDAISSCHQVSRSSFQGIYSLEKKIVISIYLAEIKAAMRSYEVNVIFEFYLIKIYI